MLLIGHLNDAEHPRFHVEKKMAMKGPASRCVGANGDGDPLSGLDDDGVLARQVVARTVLKVHPHAVQMQGMFHHRVVDEGEAHALAIAEVDRLFGF